jgi:hypothetical protein
MPECVHLLERCGERNSLPPHDHGDAHLLVPPAQGLAREAPETVGKLGRRGEARIDQLDR